MNKNFYFMNNQNNDTGMERTPVTPLPNQDEGGNVSPDFGGSDSNRPVTLLPNPGEGGPVSPDFGGSNNNRPIIPLPNPSEGNPVAGTLFPNLIGTIISTYPRPTEPCTFCNNNNGNTTNIRFLNAVSGYPPFVVFINQNLFVNPLSFSEVTEYEKVSSGIQTVTIAGENGYIYLQKPISVPTDEAATIAIFPTDSGMDIMLIADSNCTRTRRMSCIRTCNLSYNSGPLNIVIGEQYLVFNNVQYMETTNFMNIWPAEYLYHVTRMNYRGQSAFSGQTLLTASIQITRNRNYTIYLMNWKKNSPDSIKAMVVEEI